MDIAYLQSLSILADSKSVMISARWIETASADQFVPVILADSSAVRDAFDAMERQVKEYRGIARRDVKRHVSLPRGRVVRIFSDQGYGFLESGDGQEYYFHRNSVLNDAFDGLGVGMEVRFSEEVGEKGPQASTVEIAERSKSRQAPRGLAA